MRKIPYSGRMKCVKGDLLVFTQGGKSVITLREKRKLQKLHDMLQSRIVFGVPKWLLTELPNYKIEETNMSTDLQAQLKQARIDEGKITEKVKKLEKQIKEEEELKFGDIVQWKYLPGPLRIMLYTAEGNLRAFLVEKGKLFLTCDSNSNSYRRPDKNITDLVRLAN